MANVYLLSVPLMQTLELDRNFFMYPPSVGEILDLSELGKEDPFAGVVRVVSVLQRPGPVADACSVTFVVTRVTVGDEPRWARQLGMRVEDLIIR